jgi:hypothetical protein
MTLVLLGSSRAWRRRRRDDDDDDDADADGIVADDGVVVVVDAPLVPIELACAINRAFVLLVIFF